MPSFDAQSIVDGLDYSFLPFSKSAGTIREPSDRQIADFLKGLKALMEGTQERLGLAGEVDPADPEQMMQALDDLEPDEFVKVMTEMAELHSQLCSGEPSGKDIMALPMRRRLLFFGWLQSEVMAPEAGPGAGNARTAIPLRSAAG